MKLLKKNVKKAGKKLEKVNPLAQKINKNQTYDTGAETIRGIHTASKKAIKVSKTTIKTTKTTIKGAEFVASTAYRTTKKTIGIINKTYRTTRKTIIITKKIFKHVAIHVASLLISPVVWISLLGILIIFNMVSTVALIMTSDVATATAKKQYAYVSPVALKSDFEIEFANAIDYYNIAVANKKSSFSQKIDNLYYDKNNLEQSNLCMLQRNTPNTLYQKSIATTYRKSSLKGAFMMALPVEEAVAIAYIYLERLENEANGTINELYEITFTQEIFDTMVDMAVEWQDGVTHNQKCPNQNCHKYEEVSENPAKKEAYAEANYRWQACEAWSEIAKCLDQYHNIKDSRGQEQYWNNSIQWRVDNFQATYYHIDDWCYEVPWGYYDNLYQNYLAQFNYAGTLPDVTKVTKYNCSGVHDLHIINLNFYGNEIVQDRLNFTEQEHQWYDALLIEITAKVNSMSGV